MFNTGHILYMVISFIASAAVIIPCAKLLKSEEAHRTVVKVFAVLTVAIHFSSLWVDYLTSGEATVGSSMLFPIHPCNVCMWLLLIVAFMKKRDTLPYRLISEFVFWAGTVCGIIGIVFNENYGSTPTLADYEVLKGLLSHSTMIIGAVYLAASRQVNIRVSNTVSVTAGMLLLLIDGLIMNGIYALAGLETCNSMYLIEIPFPDLPFITTLTIGIAAPTVCFILSLLYERFVLHRPFSDIFTLKSFNPLTREA